MRNQLLRDADWAGMAHSLEIRVPLVDFKLLGTLASSIPAITEGAGKAALAAAPATPLPNEVVTRAKSGFGVPTGAWLKAVAGEASGSIGSKARTQGHCFAALVASRAERSDPEKTSGRGSRGSSRLMRTAPTMLALVTDAFGGRGGIAQYNRDFLGALAEMSSHITVLPRHAPDSVMSPESIRQLPARPGRLPIRSQLCELQFSRQSMSCSAGTFSWRRWRRWWRG